MIAIAFTDIETFGLNPDRHATWEVGVILRAEDGTETRHLWQIRPTWRQMRRADAKALEINKFRERFAVPRGAQAADMLADGGPKPMTRRQVRAAITAVLSKAVMVGSNAHFDASFLRVLLGAAPWHYRPVCVATLAAGFRHGQAESGAYGGDFTFPEDYPSLPYKSRDLSRAVGVEPPGADGHQALVDAEWAMAVFDAVDGQQAVQEPAA